MPAKRLFGIIPSYFLLPVYHVNPTDLSEEEAIFVIQSLRKHFPAYEKMKEIMSSDLRKKGYMRVVHFIWIVSNIRRSTATEIIQELNELSTWNPDIILVNDDQASERFDKQQASSLNRSRSCLWGVSYPNIPIIRKYPNMMGFMIN